VFVFTIASGSIALEKAAIEEIKNKKRARKE